MGNLLEEKAAKPAESPEETTHSKEVEKLQLAAEPAEEEKAAKPAESPEETTLSKEVEKLKLAAEPAPEKKTEVAEKVEPTETSPVKEEAAGNPKQEAAAETQEACPEPPISDAPKDEPAPSKNE